MDIAGEVVYVAEVEQVVHVLEEEILYACEEGDDGGDGGGGGCCVWVCVCVYAYVKMNE